jgi:hypothetical protein
MHTRTYSRFAVTAQQDPRFFRLCWHGVAAGIVGSLHLRSPGGADIERVACHASSFLTASGAQDDLFLNGDGLLSAAPDGVGDSVDAGLQGSPPMQQVSARRLRTIA